MDCMSKLMEQSCCFGKCKKRWLPSRWLWNIQVVYNNWKLIKKEILVYKANAAPFFQNDTNYFTRPVSNDPTRKQFFAKLLGAASAVSVAPKLLASSGQPLAPSATSALPVIVRSEVRTVARRAGAGCGGRGFGPCPQE